MLCFYVTDPEMYSLLLLLCWSIFDKNPLLPISVRTWFESKSAHILMHFYFDVHCFIFILSAGKGCIADMHWKCSHKAVRDCIFKTSIKYTVYAVNCKQYIVSYQHT